MKLKTIADCPESLQSHWEGLGSLFFEHPTQGIINVLGLCSLLKFKYISTAEKQIAGDFCLLRK